MARKRSTGLKRYLARELDKDERARYRRRIAALRRAAREAKAERKRRLKEAKAACKARRKRADAIADRDFRGDLARDRDKQKAATKRRHAKRRARLEEARERCALEASAIRDEAAAKVVLARAEEREEREHRRQMEQGYRAQRARKRAARGDAKKARRVAQSESDDFAKQNIPRELHPVWERVKRQMRGTERLRRDEQFLLWVHEHPEIVAQWQAEIPSDSDYAAEAAAYYQDQADPWDALEEVPF